MTTDDLIKELEARFPWLADWYKENPDRIGGWVHVRRDPVAILQEWYKELQGGR